MNNKYYTPTINEFRVGFQYELIDEQIDNFKYRTINTSIFQLSFNNLKHLCKYNKIRVKYLDLEDVRSFGFRSSGNREDLLYFGSKLEVQLKFDDKFREKGQGVGITIWNDNDEHCPAFNGFIKNISELEVILKQIEVI